ncbi:MAG: hypothetical protein ACLSFT_07750 [Ruminococcus callidus]
MRFYCANDILAIGMLKYLAQSRTVLSPAVISSDNIVESQSRPMLTGFLRKRSGIGDSDSTTA